LKESVFVVRRRELFEGVGPVQGFRILSRTDLEHDFLRRIREGGFFLERDRAERDPEFKQIIPYTVVLAEEKVFAFRRLEAQAEIRLRRKSSIGIGGHIDLADAGADPVGAGCRRELHEELAIDGSVEPEPVGVLNDDRDEVGSVHFGLVHCLRTSSEAVRIRETDRMEGGFVGLDELHGRVRRGEDFESWSRLLFGRLAALTGSGAVAGRLPAGGGMLR